MSFWTVFKRQNILASCLIAILLGSAGGRLWSDERSDLSAERRSAVEDAVSRNGPIFVDWPQPKLVLLFSGEMNGYLEPCGCAGLDNQKGGLKRRHTLIKQIEARGWPVVALDMGGQVRRLGPQAQIKYRFATESLLQIGYDAIGLGTRELQLDANYLAFVLSNIAPEQNSIVSANVGIIDFDLGLTSRYRVVEAGGKKIGITSILGKKSQLRLQNASDIALTMPEDALREILPKLEQEKCDWLVLLVHGDPEEAAALAKMFPQFRFVGTTGGAEEPPQQWRSVDGVATQLIEVGHKGMYVAVVGIYDDPQQPFRYQRVPLDHRFDDSPQMQEALVAYQEELKTTGLDGLGITGVKNPAGRFAGSAVCADCHTEAAEVFEATPHAHATQTLVDLDPPRHFDPECLSCHATGWKPQEYFPYASGYLGLQTTPRMVGNGCENCHGPGAAHAAAENSDNADEAQLEQLRAAMRLKIIENEGNQEGQVFDQGAVVKKCMECHDLDNSPDFDFQEYWPQVEH